MLVTDATAHLISKDNLPKSTLSKHISVIAAEHHDSVLVKTALLQSAKKLANAIINVADCTIISPSSSLDLVISKILFPHIGDLHKSLAVRILLVLGDLDFR